MQLTKEYIQDLLAVTTPDNPAAAGWYVDDNEVLRLKKAINLYWPIKIRYQGSGKYRRGTHYSRMRSGGGYYHNIVINHNITAEQANETLLHEIGHARQAEMFEEVSGLAITDFYRIAYRKFGYSGAAYEVNPYEVDAREFAEMHKDRKVVKR